MGGVLKIKKAMKGYVKLDLNLQEHCIFKKALHFY